MTVPEIDTSAAADQPVATRSRRWLTATILSIVLGLASAGAMTAVMFMIGDYYRGPQIDRNEQSRQQLQELRSAAEQELQSYGWINRTDGVVRIPVDRAMQLLAAEKRLQGQESKPSPTDDADASSK